MEYMYNYSITAHLYSIYGMIAVILFNLFFTYKITELPKLRRFMLIFTPMGSVMLAGAIFTGIIMMAAKHLEFTLANIVMIVLSIFIIILEAKRSKSLRFTTTATLQTYKTTAYKLLGIELGAIIAVVIFVIMVR